MTFIDPLGELEKTYRESYEQCCNDFVARANRFGDEHKKARFNIPRCEPVTSEEQLRSVTEQRETEWNAYEVCTMNDRRCLWL